MDAIPLDSSAQTFVEVGCCRESEALFGSCGVQAAAGLAVGFGFVPPNAALEAHRLRGRNWGRYDTTYRRVTAE